MILKMLICRLGCTSGRAGSIAGSPARIRGRMRPSSGSDDARRRVRHTPSKAIEAIESCIQEYFELQPYMHES